MICHARCGNTVGSGRVPDLNLIPPVYYDNFNQIVLDGVMEKQGMVGFSDVLSEEDADDIKAYLLNRANNAWELRNQPQWCVSFKRWFYGLIATVISWVVG